MKRFLAGLMALFVVACSEGTDNRLVHPQMAGYKPVGYQDLRYDRARPATAQIDFDGFHKVGLKAVSSFTGGTITTPMLAGDGSAAAPSYSWSSDSNTGFYWGGGSGQQNWSSDGTAFMQWDSTGMGLHGGWAIKWGSSGIASPDLYLKRYAAKQVSITGDGTGATTNAGWIIGYLGSSGYGGMWNSGLTPTTSNYALAQDSNGRTLVNAASGQSVSFGIANAEKARITSGGNFELTQGDNGQIFSVKALTELTTIAAAATTDTTIQMPANAVILGVSVRVTTVIPTAATFTVGDSGNASRFNTAAVSTAANSTDPGTKAGAYYNASALSVRITPNLTPADNTGRVRVTIHYYTVTPPTS